MIHRKKGANFMLKNEVFGRSGGGYTVIRQFPKHDFIMASYEPFGKDITGIINNM